MKNTISRQLPWAAFTAIAIGSASLALATPQAAPEGASEIAEFIQMDVSNDSQMKGAEVTVEIKDNIAVLSGNARSLAQTERAGARAIASTGVHAVVNRISVEPQATANLIAGTKAILKAQKIIDSKKIAISASGNRISLRGEVGTLDEKDLAREIVSEVPGVIAIDNDLTVNFEGIRGDSQIQEQLKFIIKDDPLYEGLDLIATVKDGTVKLSGQVGSKGEYDRLVRRSYVTGVMDVQISGLSIERHLALEGLGDKDYNKEESVIALNKALDIDTRVDAKAIRVGWEEGVVSLKGNVDTVASRDIVESTARAIPGVLRVDNELRISSGSGLATNSDEFKAASPALVKDSR